MLPTGITSSECEKSKEVKEEVDADEAPCVSDTLSALLNQLPEAFSAERCDALTLDIALVVCRSRAKRKRVALELCHFPSNKLSVAPFFCQDSSHSVYCFP
ncbi:hypothetical protein GEMRC1_013005 [Eukaryota sp. GEM-RC1]